MRAMLTVLAMLVAGCGAPATLQTVVYVTTYKDGQTDIVRRDLLFRGKLGPNTVRDTLKRHGLREGVTLIKGE